MTTNTSPLTADTIIQNLLSSKGQFRRAIWKSNPTPASAHKKNGVVLEKRTSAIVRSGINFSNLSAVKIGIENGERSEVGELPFGEWYIDSEGRNFFPYVIRHVPKNTETETFYLRLYPSDTKSHTIYYVNGSETTKEDFMQYLTPSEAKKMTDGEAPLCFTVKRDNIIGMEEFEG
jgi:hypothetical protein